MDYENVSFSESSEHQGRGRKNHNKPLSKLYGKTPRFIAIILINGAVCVKKNTLSTN